MPAHDSYVGLTPLHVCPWLKLCCLSRSVLRQPHESSWLPIRVDARARTASPHEHWQSHIASRCPGPSRRTTASRQIDVQSDASRVVNIATSSQTLTARQPSARYL